jgi:Trypsin
MRRLSCCCLFASLVAVGCGPAGSPSAADGPVGRASSRIIDGSPDTTHTAVVAILANAGQNSFDECSGSIVAVQNGNGYVLTAAHCCGGEPGNPVTPGVVILANDYSSYENDIGIASSMPPAYAVVPGSVSWDQSYDPNSATPTNDFCMLQFSGADASTPTISLPTSANDGLALGVEVEYSGFGVTDGNGNNNNSKRNHVSAPVDQLVTADYIKYSEGGNVGGPCSGDSGGPALLPAGAPQSQQTVVATTSYGDASCSSGRLHHDVPRGRRGHRRLHQRHHLHQRWHRRRRDL